MYDHARHNPILFRLLYAQTRPITIDEIRAGEDDTDRKELANNDVLLKQQSIVSLVLMFGFPVVGLLGFLLGNLPLSISIALILAAQCLRFNSKITAHRISRGMRASISISALDSRGNPVRPIEPLNRSFARYVQSTVFGLPFALVVQSAAMLLTLLPSPTVQPWASLTINVSMVVFVISVVSILVYSDKMQKAMSEVLGETS